MYDPRSAEAPPSSEDLLLLGPERGVHQLDDALCQLPCGPVDRVRQRDHGEAVRRIEERASDVAGEAAAVADHPALADRVDAEPEPVPLLRAFDVPLAALHPPLARVGEQPLVAEHVTGRIPAEVLGGRPEAGGGRECPGIDRVDRESPVVRGQAGVADGIFARPGRVQLGSRVAELEPADDVLGHVVGVRLTADRLDHQPQHAVPDVRVLELLVSLEHVGFVEAGGDQRLRVRKGSLELPEVRLVGVAHDAAAVSEQLGDRPIGDPRSCESGDVLLDGVVEPQPARLDELHDRRRRERLGMGGDPEQVPGRQRFAGVVLPVRLRQPREPVRGRQEHLAGNRDGDLDARDRAACGPGARPSVSA